MEQLSYLDHVFDDASRNWDINHIDQHFTQRNLKDSDKIVCETLLTVHGTTDIEPALKLICGEWNWWDHGRITDFIVNPDGTSDQILSPVWWFITRVGLHLYPPTKLPDRDPGKRVPLMLSGHFVGPSSMDVYPSDSGDSVTIRGRFHGVEYTMPAIPNMIAEGLHLGAEAGTMPTPFPKGTGWVGLLKKLEAQAGVPEALTSH